MRIIWYLLGVKFSSWLWYYFSRLLFLFLFFSLVLLVLCFLFFSPSQKAFSHLFTHELSRLMRLSSFQPSGFSFHRYVFRYLFFHVVEKQTSLWTSRPLQHRRRQNNICRPTTWAFFKHFYREARGDRLALLGFFVFFVECNSFVDKTAQTKERKIQLW